MTGTQRERSFVRLPPPRGQMGCVALLAALALASGAGEQRELSYKAELGVRETYDSNIYIQDKQPYATVTAPKGYVIARPQADSFVTTVTPNVGLSYKPCEEFNLSADYAPDMVWYHAASSEDYIAHRGHINFSGDVDGVVWEWLNRVTWVDGNDEGPLFLRPGDVPAVGGIPLRDRRDQAVFRNSLQFTIPLGKWFVRPVFSSYVHDFQTKQRSCSDSSRPNTYYENYIDREEIGGGLDAGCEVCEKTRIVAGYRFGRQHQGKLLGAESPYSNYYHRFLAGVEGTPAKWIKLAIMAGPDVRDFDPNTPRGFHRGEVLCYLDGSITLTPTPEDTLTLQATRYEQPAFSSHSVYEDIRYDVSYRHKFTDQLAARVGFTIHVGDWQAPVNRDDWIYTPGVVLTYAFANHWTADLSYYYDWVDNTVSPTHEGATYADGRKWTRHLVSLGVKYSF
ncbi:MAG: hypothetical protein N2689_01080 [Verrucomicrobiae bacterium]|nr:hypothetical protein [Verrucomicrobiae bacterium]